MSIDEKLKNALKDPDPDHHTVILPVDAAARDRVTSAVTQILKLLHAETKGPAEGYATLGLCQQWLEEEYGIHAGGFVQREGQS